VVDRLADLYAPDETRLWLYARIPCSAASGQST
jgi:hypothetical protein